MQQKIEREEMGIGKARERLEETSLLVDQIYNIMEINVWITLHESFNTWWSNLIKFTNLILKDIELILCQKVKLF